MLHLLNVSLSRDEDVVLARHRAARAGALLGFSTARQVRLAAAVSEAARHVVQGAGGGCVAFLLEEGARPQRLVIRVVANHAGSPHPAAGGMGAARMLGAGRLVDRVTVGSATDEPFVVLEKHLPATRPLLSAEDARSIANALSAPPPRGLLEELRQENEILLRTVDELQQKERELARLNRELEDTNRGILALYSELDDKAEHLRRAHETKSRFLSNVTHEFRTPVNAILGLADLLLEGRRRSGRDPEPEVVYIRKAAESLAELVDDLLDLASLESGRTAVRPADCDVGKLLGALRGTLRPLLVGEAVALVTHAPDGLPPLYTDEGKLSQILRNLATNALKFTEHGEVRISAGLDRGGTAIRFVVSDTGIGIAAEDQERIFEEFTQLQHRLQREARGTGLGLPLSRRLAALLGGTLEIESRVGVGSTFTLIVPVRYSGPAETSEPQEALTAATRRRSTEDR